MQSHYSGLDKVKRRLTEYLAVVHPRALITQKAEMEQAKVQGVHPDILIGTHEMLILLASKRGSFC